MSSVNFGVGVEKRGFHDDIVSPLQIDRAVNNVLEKDICIDFSLVFEVRLSSVSCCVS